ncbi:Alpha/Beta hydrolase protein [Dichotomocladium elegans]|nr:Alpha/Beta hydrolase protein [Dichotomocladium elegans]
MPGQRVQATSAGQLHVFFFFSLSFSLFLTLALLINLFHIMVARIVPQLVLLYFVTLACCLTGEIRRPYQSPPQAVIIHPPRQRSTYWRLWTSIFHQVFRKSTPASSAADELQIRATSGILYRPVSKNYVYDLYRHHPTEGRGISAWAETSNVSVSYAWQEGLLPDVTHHSTVLALAKMASNAYYAAPAEINNGTTSTSPDWMWYDLGSSWKLLESFGWAADGLRGHVYQNMDASVLIISFKGTNAGLLGSDSGPTSGNDKLNDNMLFSCCCAYSPRAWNQVCDCHHGDGSRNTCETSCLERSIQRRHLYYDQAMEVYKDVSDRHPGANIWLTGHALGGAIASLVAQTFLVPTVTFESPGERLAATRLHLPRAPGIDMPLWHFGHTADPIFSGRCSDPSSYCWFASGYAMETRCHAGKVCVWDTVSKRNWKMDIRNHRIQAVIDGILGASKDVLPIPKCAPEREDCQECRQWEYVDRRDLPRPSPTPTSTIGPSPPTPNPPSCRWW